MWGKKKNKHGPPLPTDGDGRASIAVEGVPIAGSRRVVVVSDVETIHATVMNDPWYDKVLVVQSASPDPALNGHWVTATFGLDREQARTLGAALLGLADATVEARPGERF